ncbi:hypothetical protein K1719_002822 [Acacia pycnantha]|nr:hypothetical protein K1719_002822 [Acacia pycnantha]
MKVRKVSLSFLWSWSSMQFRSFPGDHSSTSQDDSLASEVNNASDSSDHRAIAVPADVLEPDQFLYTQISFPVIQLSLFFNLKDSRFRDEVTNLGIIPVLVLRWSCRDEVTNLGI